MKTISFIFILVVLFSCAPKRMNYPVTKKVDTVDVYFGEKVADPYRWLEDDNSAETKAWVEEQNKVTNAYLAEIPFREKIKNKLTQLWNYEKVYDLQKEGGLYIFSKNNGLQNQSVLYYQKSLTDSASILFDPNTLSKDGTVALNTWAISPDGKYFAYGVSKSGSDWVTIYVNEISGQKLTGDSIEWVKFSGIAWDKNGFYYCRYDSPKQNKGLTDKNLNQKLYYHKLGTSQAQDVLIMKDDTDPTMMFGAGVTEDLRYLIVTTSRWSNDGNNLLIKDLSRPSSDFVRIGNGFDIKYWAFGNIGDKLYMITNLDAPLQKLVCVDLKSPDVKNWKDIIPQKEYLLNNAVLFAGDKIVADYLKDAYSKLEIYDSNGKYLKDITLPAIGTVDGISGKVKSDELFYSFTSFTYPTTSFIYNLITSGSRAFYTTKAGVNPNDYEIKQEFYTSKDGTKVPMFIVHKKGLKLDGNNPALLYGYGGFDISLTPSFSISRLFWLENGGVYAVANLRGGGEYGKKWHEGGMKLNKQNVFDDFIAAAEFLISRKYTSSKMLAINGGSNGGLLIGAVTNQRPDLFRVAVPQVGVMDMLRFHKFTIGGAWVNDFGSSDDSVQYHYIKKYSPLHTIKEGVNYPSILVTTADHDDRVVPAHSFKYIATLQEKYKGPNPVLIRIQTKAGHGAGKPTSIAIAEIADIYSFIFYNLGVTPVLD